MIVVYESGNSAQFIETPERADDCHVCGIISAVVQLALEYGKSVTAGWLSPSDVAAYEATGHLPEKLTFQASTESS